MRRRIYDITAGSSGRRPPAGWQESPIPAPNRHSRDA